MLGWILRVHPKGVKARGFTPESHATQMLPGRVPTPRLALLKGWGRPQNIVPVVALALVGRGQPRAQCGVSVALLGAGGGFVFEFPVRCGQGCPRAGKVTVLASPLCDGWPVSLQKGYRKEDFLGL